VQKNFEKYFWKFSLQNRCDFLVGKAKAADL